MSEAWTMGGYGLYVWGSFGLTLAVLIICALQGKHRQRKVVSEIRTHLKAMESKQ